MPALGLTAELIRRIAAAGDHPVPDEVADIVRRALVDTVAVLLAGSGENVVHFLERSEPNEVGCARLAPSGLERSARVAALVNGAAAHVLDFDDVGLGDGHPSAVLLPALLAVGEDRGLCFDDIARGYLCGYEAWGMLRTALGRPLHGAGWHPSGVFGAMASAAGCAAALRLPEDMIRAALGLAAAQAGGLTANFGTDAKSIQVGNAAAAGIVAVERARVGISASDDIIDRPGGFLTVFGGARDTMAPAMPEDWWLLRSGLDVKLYPLCYAAHRLVDAALDIVAHHDIDTAAISEIEVHLGLTQSAILNSRDPRTPLSAKFSAEFAVAATLLSGRAPNSAAMSKGALGEPALRHLIALVARHEDERTGPNPPFAPEDRIVVTMGDGSLLYSRAVEHASGNRYAPPDEAELHAKFVDLAGPVLGSQAANRAFVMLRSARSDMAAKRIVDVVCGRPPA